MTSAAMPTPEASAPANSFSRLIGALFSPKPTFASIASRPTWILPLVLISIFGCATTYLYGQRVGWRAFIQKQIEASPRTQSMPEDQKERVIDQQTKFAPIFGYGGTIVFAFGGAALVAAVFLLAFNVASGTKLQFKTALAIVAYAWVPLIVSQVLGMIILFIKDPATIDIQNLIASNAGAFLSEDSPKWMQSLCGSLDVFSLWSMALMGVGFGATNPKKLPFGKAFGTVIGVWLVYVIVKVGLAAAFS